MKRGVAICLLKETARFPSFFLFLFLSLASIAKAGEVDLSGSVGYDSNPGLYEESEGTAFAAYALSASHNLFSNDSAYIRLTGSASYRDNFSLGDSLRLDAESEVSFPVMKGRLIPAIATGGAIYRDKLVEEDERNEIFGDFRLSWIASPRYTISFSSGIRYHTYVNEARTYGWRPNTGFNSYGTGGHGRRSLGERKGPGGGRGRGNDGGIEAAPTYSERHDTILTGGMATDVAFSPSLIVRFNAVAGRLDSNVSYEDRDILEFEMSIEKRLIEVWKVALGVSYGGYWFAESRSDKKGFAYAGLYRSMGRWAFFLKGAAGRNDSSAVGQSYNQVITECGASFSY